MLGELNPVRYGRYLLLDRINVGGMAEVFRGKTAGVEGFERIVALKRILPNIAADPDFVQMFVEEAKLVVELQHANIAQVYDLGKAEGTYYIAMEYVSGTDLRNMWDRARTRNRLLPIAMSCYIMQRVCEGLDAAHRKKDNEGQEISLVHRDVSPQNILISYEGEVKLIDFGIARAANRVSKTQAGVLKGKFGYMSPEQVRGVDLDNRSDIFACGVVLYELLVGDRLFLGESDFSTLEKVRNVEMVPPTRLNKNLSPHLERIVMKALAKTREDRYRWANEMAEDLQRYLFATNQPFARTDMQRYMQQHFRPEMEDERERLDRYKQISLANYGSTEPTTQEHPMPMPPVAAAQQPVTGTMPQLPAASTFGAPNVASMNPLAVAEVPASIGPNGVPTPAGPPSALPLPASAVMPPRPSALPLPSGAAVIAPPRQSLPTWAAVLIGALTVLLFGAGVVLAWVLMTPKPRPGSLVVEANPSKVQLFVNGKLVATQTPFTLDDLVSDTYVLTARAEQFEETVRAIRLRPGERRLVTIDLARKPGTASLIVRTNPKGLHVSINDRDSGLVTPATISGLYPGEQTVLLKRDDGSIVHRFRMPLTTGSAEVVEIDTRRLPALLEVTSRPSGARIEVRGRPKGATPATISGLRTGSALVVVSKPGCLPFRQNVRLSKATITPLKVMLTCPSVSDEAVAAAGTAKATFTATLVSDIFVDGRKIGRTPFFNLELPAGKHSLRLVPITGDRPAFESEFTVAAGDPPKTLHHRF